MLSALVTLFCLLTFTNPPTTASATAVGGRVLDFCKANLEVQVGDGECSSLADEALKASGATLRRAYAQSPGDGDYVWGRQVMWVEAGERQTRYALAEGERVEPGDIMQFRDARFEGNLPGRRTYARTAAHHTAVVLRVSGKRMLVLHQNSNGNRTVHEENFNLADLKQGWIRIYRPQSAPTIE